MVGSYFCSTSHVPPPPFLSFNISWFPPLATLCIQYLYNLSCIGPNLYCNTGFLLCPRVKHGEIIRGLRSVKLILLCLESSSQKKVQFGREVWRLPCPNFCWKQGIKLGYPRHCQSTFHHSSGQSSPIFNCPVFSTATLYWKLWLDPWWCSSSLSQDPLICWLYSCWHFPEHNLFSLLQATVQAYIHFAVHQYS